MEESLQGGSSNNTRERMEASQSMCYWVVTNADPHLQAAEREELKPLSVSSREPPVCRETNPPTGILDVEDQWGTWCSLRVKKKTVVANRHETGALCQQGQKAASLTTTVEPSWISCPSEKFFWCWSWMICCGLGYPPGNFGILCSL